MTVFFSLTSLMPWDNCLKSFAKYLSQILLSEPLIRCLYSWATPEIWWVTEFVLRFFWHCDVNVYRGRGFLLPLDLKLKLVPPLSTLVGCAVFTLGDGIRTSGRIMCGPDGDLWTLWWNIFGSFTSSSSMTLGCSEGIYFVCPGCSVWGITAAVCSDYCYGGSDVLFSSLSALVNILESCSIANNWDSPMFENGAWGAGFFKA